MRLLSSIIGGRSPSWRALLLGVSIGSAALVARGHDDGASGRGETLESRIAVILERVDPTEATGEEAVRSLAALGVEARNSLFAVFVADGFSVGEPPTTRRLTDVQRHVLVEAMLGHGRMELFVSLRERAAETDDPAIRVAVLRLLGSVARADDIAFLGEVALPTSGESSFPPTVAAAFQDALTGTLRRDPDAFSFLESFWASAPEEMAPPILMAVGAAGDPRGLTMLGDLLGPSSDVARITITQIARLAAVAPPDIGLKLHSKLRAYLSGDDHGLQQSAAIALGKLGDVGAVPDLIALLDGEHAGVRDNALWALRRITAMPFSADARLWRNWAEAERTWLKDVATDDLTRLTSDDPAEVVEAIHQLSRHRFFRRRISPELAKLLSHENAEIRRLAVHGLMQLACPSCVPDLIWSLDDEDEAVSDAALLALCSLTGLDLPADRSEWEDALMPASGSGARR